jgi:[acyl-carrier-protein] S-malonyltransferase
MMRTVLVIVAPGQGAQTPGFLSPWLEESSLREDLGRLSEVAQLDLQHYGTEADAETIKDTAVAQPLLVAASLLTARALSVEDAALHADAVSGHSVGEIAAASLAGVLSPDDSLVFVRERGTAMAEASAVTPTGMTAVLGGDRADVLSTLERHGVTPANDNGAGQIVAAGTLAELEALAGDPPASARLIPLSVAGAFHTVHMQPAVEALAKVAESIDVADPRTKLISNRDGQTVDSGEEVVERLVAQVSNPVRWDLCMQTMSELGVTGLLELAPAGTLVGIARRQLKGVATFALKTPDQLDDARVFVDEHAAANPV